METIFDKSLDTEQLVDNKDTYMWSYVIPKKMRWDAEFHAEKFAGKNQQERFLNVFNSWPTVRSTVEKVKILLPVAGTRISGVQRKVNAIKVKIG